MVGKDGRHNLAHLSKMSSCPQMLSNLELIYRIKLTISYLQYCMTAAAALHTLDDKEFYQTGLIKKKTSDSHENLKIIKLLVPLTKQPSATI